ncbi:unnamed protein product [Rotaria sordida]|uniref:Uncharacterized protein n=1 Tax=Rotaria sordida TaxID=392033 RepID=A0A815CS04_9BILA|nr:unnamed protein product [Rotaria sordida]CAF1515367.1 unnamed protein product [Rotaria sordida]
MSGMSAAERLRNDNVRLCRLCFWSNFEGLGFNLEKSAQPPHIIRLVEPNSPAAAGGLKILDVVLTVNQEDVSQADYSRVRDAIKIACDSKNPIELLVAKQRFYQQLKTKIILINPERVTIINTPEKMPSDYLNFPKHIPRTCYICLNDKETLFGFETIHGEKDIGLCIQKVFPNTPASNTSLRKCDRIIEINDKYVDNDLSSSILEKLKKAKMQGVVKLYVVDTETYKYAQVNKISLKSKRQHQNELTVSSINHGNQSLRPNTPIIMDLCDSHRADSIKLNYDNQEKFHSSTIASDRENGELDDICCVQIVFTLFFAAAQKTSIANGDSNAWDLTTLTALLLSTDRPKTLNKTEIQQLNNEDKLLKQLRDIRNNLAHHPSKSIDNTEFDQLWIELVAILGVLGDMDSELNKLKHDSVFELSVQSINEENMKEAKRLNSLGTQAHKAGNFFDAIRLFTKATDLSNVSDHDRAVFYSNMSSSRLALYEPRSNLSNNFDTFESTDQRYRALQDAKEARNLWPTWWKGHFRVALDESRQIYERQSRYEHLDPRLQPGTIDEHLNEMKQKLGTDPDKVQLGHSLLEGIDPASANVVKGHKFEHGDIDVKQNYEQAAKYFAKAASQGNAEGMYNIGQLTDLSLGVKKDHRMARMWFEKAAAQLPQNSLFPDRPNLGVAEAEHALGLRYAAGVSVDKNLETAAYWYQRAVDHGSAPAANNLALMYLHGTGVDQDLEKAEQLLQLSARNGDQNAMLTLSGLLLSKNDPQMAKIWHDRASVALRLLDKDMNEAIEAYRAFLTIAPKDHRKVPESYYAMANCYFELHQRDISTDIVKKVYEQGEEAEKVQLPCFLPYDSNNKTELKFMFDRKSPPNVNVVAPLLDRKSRLLDPHRIRVIKQHRQWQAALLEARNDSMYTFMSGSHEPRAQQQAVKSLIGLKPISLREIDPTKDHVYNGYVLSVTIIEDAYSWTPSIHLVIEDEHLDCERMFIYGFPEGHGKYLTSKVFTLGSKMSIMNPYLRLGGSDMKSSVRIDDFSSIIMQNESERVLNMCRCCGTSNALHVCGKCKQAHYCTKECQITDWKLYGHKLICKKQ